MKLTTAGRRIVVILITLLLNSYAIAQDDDKNKQDTLKMAPVQDSPFELPPMHPGPFETVENACKKYANDSVAQNKENLKRNCGYKGSAWNSDYQYHYSWCMHGENLKYTSKESRARQAAIAKCICEPYAKDAIAQNKDNLALGCGYSGPRWSSGFSHHYDWCVRGGNVLLSDNEKAGRGNDLAKCKKKFCGYIMVRAIGNRGIGRFDVPEQRSVRVETRCPVNVDTKVTLSSVKKPGYKGSLAQWEDTGVISIKGSGDSVIPSGKSSTDFVIKAVKQGFSWLKVTSDHYIQVEEAWGTDLLWNHPGLERINVSTGTGPKVNPNKIEITEGQSFKLKFTLDPVPWAACGILFEPWPTYTSPLNGRLSFQPKKLVVPAGQKFGTVKITALKKGPAAGDLYVRPDYYSGSPSHITIKAAAPPPPPPPPPKENTTTVNGYKQVPYTGKIYYLAKVNIPKATVIAITNPNLGLGKQWIAQIIPGGVSSQDCGKPGKTIDIPPGSSSTKIKGTSLYNFTIGFCLTTKDSFTWSQGLPQVWGLKIKYQKN